MPDKKLTLEMAARTDAGRERAANEDNFLGTSNYRSADWILPPETYTDAGTVMVVADGMGGLNAGEVASRITVDSIKEFLQNFEKTPASDDATRNTLSKAILYAHKKVVAHSKEHAETQGMGSTVVIGFIARNKIYFSWSGDSRGYIFRQGRLQQLTKDHSYVQSLVDDGKLTAEQAFLHPESNVILQSIGDVDRAPQPDHVSFLLGDNDILLLCSDGVNSMLQDAEIEKVLADHTGSLSQCAEKLVEAANQAGGVDNITVMLVRVVAGAGAVKTPVTSSETTLDPFAQTTLENMEKEKNKKLWFIVVVLLVLITSAYLLAPMINKPVTTDPVKPAVVDTMTKQKGEADSVAQKKRQEKRADSSATNAGATNPAGKPPVHTPARPPKQKGDSTNNLTPIEPKQKDLLKKVEEHINEKKPADTVNHPDQDQTDHI